MESDDSHDSSSSDSDTEVQNNEPASPASVRSTNSQTQSSERRSQSPEDDDSQVSVRSRSESPNQQNQQTPASPTEDNRSMSVLSMNSSQMDTQSHSPHVDRISRNSDKQSPDRSLKSPSFDRESNRQRSNSRDSQSSMSPQRDQRSSSPSSNHVERLSRSNRSPSSDRGSIASPRSRSQESNKSVSSTQSQNVDDDDDDDGNSSDSSESSRGSKRHKSFSSNVSASAAPLETQAEEISDGEMELDAGKESDNDNQSEKKMENNIKMSHEDLSDVSDLDSLGEQSDEEDKSQPAVENDETEEIKAPPTDLRRKLDEAKNRKVAEPPKLIEKTSKTEDGEEALDFEAEDGECVEELPKEETVNNAEINENGDGATGNGDDVTIVEVEEKKKPEEDLEEGEVTDDEETRPEETEPRPVCRFYSRGQCTWGASCRFLHPGVTDKGNYTMFEMIRPVVPGPPLSGFTGDFRDERPAHLFARVVEPPPAESAWERGLRTAKEMVRRAIKRKEQDMDFEEKKMNLTLSQDELDKENGYYTRAATPVLIEPSPPPPVKHYVRHPAPHDPYYPPPQRHPDEYYRRVHHYEPPAPAIPIRQVRIEPDYDPPPRERVHSYREMPTHRIPDYYDKYDERTVTVSNQKRHPRPKREVIVQRVEAPPPGRGDEWADPWMRSKSPGQRGAGRSSGATRRQSYSSGSSYSSSSSTRSSSASSSRSTSYRRRSRSRSISPRSRRRMAAVTTATTAVAPTDTVSPAYRDRREPERSRRRARGVVSPSVIVSERKAAHERASLMNPPAPSPRKPHKDIRPPSPGMMRTSAQNPPAPVKMSSTTDQFGRTTKREVDRITSERRNLDPERKKLVVAAALAARVKGRVMHSSRSSSGSESSGSSSSDSESSYTSSSSSRDESTTNKRTDRAELAMALKAKGMDAFKGDRNLENSNKKRPALSPPSGESASKIAALSKSNVTGTQSSSAGGGGSGGASGGKKATSRREELLKQLKAVEDAIAKKRSKIN